MASAMSITVSSVCRLRVVSVVTMTGRLWGVICYEQLQGHEALSSVPNAQIRSPLMELDSVSTECY